MNRNGNSENFFLYVCTLNGIPASVRCVSSIIVVLNAKFARLLAAHANKKAGEKRRSPTRVKTHKHSIFIAVLTVHAKNESILYFPTIYAS